LIAHWSVLQICKPAERHDGPAGQASSSNASGCRPGLRLVPTSYLLRAYETEQSRLICLDALIYHLPIALTSSILSSRPPADPRPPPSQHGDPPQPLLSFIHDAELHRTTQSWPPFDQSIPYWLPTLLRANMLEKQIFNSATKHRAKTPNFKRWVGTTQPPDKSNFGALASQRPLPLHHPFQPR